MLSINFPEPSFRIKTEQGRELIYDSLRKKWVQLTPEEWVRQNFTRYLTDVMKYPASLIALEKKIRLGELAKRFDLLVYDKTHQPWMLIECKAMDVTLDEKVLNQVLRYHISVPVTYLVITNGKHSYAWKKTAAGLEAISRLPEAE